jgi:hypothetical protein
MPTARFNSLQPDQIKRGRRRRMRKSLLIGAMFAVIPALAFGQTGWGRIAKNGPLAEFRDGDWSQF